MHFFAFLNFVTFLIATTQPQKAVIISYPNDTPQAIIDQAKKTINAGGGRVIHEYTIIRYEMFTRNNMKIAHDNLANLLRKCPRPWSKMYKF